MGAVRRTFGPSRSLGIGTAPTEQSFATKSGYGFRLKAVGTANTTLRVSNQVAKLFKAYASRFRTASQVDFAFVDRRC